MPDVAEQTTAPPATALLRPALPEGRLEIQLDPPPSDREFWALCQENDDIRIEQNPDGSLVIMPPTGGSSGNRIFYINHRLAQWIDADGGGVGFDSSTMFRLPNGAKRMPDAAWVQRERYRALSQSDRDGIVPLAPDFVIEMRSPSDDLSPLRNKMNEYVRAGVRLAWLIDPQTETVQICRDDGSTETLDRPETVEAESVVDGFVLPMDRIWDPVGES